MINLFRRLEAAIALPLVLATHIWGVSCLYADMEFPPHLEGEAEIAAFVGKILEDHPYLPGMHQRNGYKIDFTVLATKQQKLISELVKREDFQRLNPQRPPLVTLTAKLMEDGEVEVLTLKKEPFQRQQEEILTWLKKNAQDAPEALGGITDRIREITRLLTIADAKALINGLIHCLPGEHRGALFKFKTDELKIEALKDLTILDDQLVKEQFKPEPYDLNKDDLSRDFVFGLIEERQALEQELLTLLRIGWIKANGTRKTKAFLKEGKWNEAIESLKTSHLSFADESVADEIETYLDELVEPLLEGKAKKQVSRFWERVTKSLVAENDYKKKLQATKVAGKKLFIRELPPYLAVFRGYVAGDCTTANCWAMVYTPTDRTYFLYDEQNQIQGLISGSLITTGGYPTLYLHDGKAFQGHEQMLLAVGALALAGPQLGFEQISIPANGNWDSLDRGLQNLIRKENPEQKNDFPDAELREWLKRNYGGYDNDLASRAVNSQVIEFDPEKLEDIQVDVEGNDGVWAVDGNDPVAAMTRALALSADRADIEKLSVKDVDDDDLRELFALVRNEQHLPLEEYYGKLHEAFAEYGIELSNKFIKANEGAFWQGHFEAPDVFTTPSPMLAKRTVRFTLTALKKSRHREAVYELMAKGKDFFQKSDLFQKYLAELTGERENDAEILQKLEAAGFDISLVTARADKLFALLARASEAQKAWALNHLRKADREGVTDEMLEEVSKYLDNVDHEEEELSLQAVRVLLRFRTQNEEVNQSLEETVEDEDNLKISFRAAVALLLNKQKSALAVVHLHENLETKAVPPKLRAKAKELVAKRNVKSCRQMLADRSPDDIPEYEE